MNQDAHFYTRLPRPYRYWQWFDCAHQGGFTLLELLIVLLVSGVLASIALPTLIGQVGRARESEGKGNLSAVGQAQQAYFFENSTFADDYSLLELNFQSNNYIYPAPTLLNPNVVKHQADAINAVARNTRNLSLGVYFSDFVYSVILCRSSSPSTPTVVPDTDTGTCSDGGTLEF